MEIIQSTCGRLNIILDRYINVRHKDLANGVESYESEKRRRNYCRARIRVNANVCVNVVNEHTHDPEI